LRPIKPRAPAWSKPGPIRTRAATGANAHATTPPSHLPHHFQLAFVEYRLELSAALLCSRLTRLGALLHERHDLTSLNLACIEL
jgi:hypothetical protein